MRWTAAEVATLRSLVEQHRSGSQIGHELGRTKNSVIGKCDRLDLTLKGGTGGRHAVRPAHKAKAKGRRMTSATPQTPPAQLLKTEQSMPPPTEAPEPKLLSILQLTERTCKWPYGHPGASSFGFCGHPSPVGVPYCSAHAVMAFNDPPRKLPYKPWSA